MSRPEPRPREDRLDGLLRKAIAEMPAPEVDLAPSVLAQIEGRPSLLTVALQMAVLVVLGGLAVSLFRGAPPELPQLDLTEVLAYSAQALPRVHAWLASVPSLAGGLAEPASASLELALAGLFALVLLNVGASRRLADAGGRR